MKYGAKGAYWAPMTSDESDSAMPVYETAVDFGGINESTETLNFASASAYADNMKKIYIAEFIDGTVSAKALYQPISLQAAILGTATDSDGGQAYGSEDNQGYGAYGFYSNKLDENKTKYYEVVFYPKVQGSPQGTTYKTKEDGITLEYDAIEFVIYACKRGLYKITKEFSTESEAQSYLAGLFEGTSTVPGDTTE